MHNRFRVNSIAASAVLLILPGCAGCNHNNSASNSDNGKVTGTKSMSLVTNYAPIEFAFPAGWHVNPEDHPFDLQVLSRRQEMNTGVFVFKKEDVALDSTPTHIFWRQVEDMKSKRKNFIEQEAVRREEYEDKTITSVTYAGEKDLSRDYYTFSLVEFRGNDSVFAVVLQVSKPGDWAASKPILESIARSAKLVPERN